MKKKVLIIDDEPSIAELTAFFLTEAGCETTHFTSSRKALACLRSQDFDVLVSDIRMPEMSGIEMLNYLIADQIELPKKIIFVTGFSIDIEEKQKDSNWPRVAVLHKPVEFSELVKVVLALGE